MRNLSEWMMSGGKKHRKVELRKCRPENGEVSGWVAIAREDGQVVVRVFGHTGSQADRGLLDTLRKDARGTEVRSTGETFEPVRERVRRRESGVRMIRRVMNDFIVRDAA